MRSFCRCLGLLLLLAGGCDVDSERATGGYEAETGSAGDGAEGSSLTYANGHPLDWRTDDVAALQREDEVLALVNAHRGSIGVGPLRMVQSIRHVARGQSRHMRKDVHEFFEHVNPEGDSPGMRLSRNGIGWRRTGENISSGLLSPADAVAGWLASPGHRRNLENPVFTRTGIGWASGPPGDYPDYWTQVFVD